MSLVARTELTVDARIDADGRPDAAWLSAVSVLNDEAVLARKIVCILRYRNHLAHNLPPAMRSKPAAFPRYYESMSAGSALILASVRTTGLFLPKRLKSMTTPYVG